MENETSSLDDILNGDTAPEPQVETPAGPEPAAPAAEAQPRDEHGRFAPKGENEPPATGQAAEPGASPAPKDEPPLEHPALIGERRRRQEAERQLQELQQQLAAAQQPPQPAPSIWEDEEGALRHFGSQVVDVATQQATFNARLDMSEMLVRQQNSDFEEIKGRFLEMMRENPVLQQQALSDAHPWNFAYQYVKKADRVKELGAVDVADLEAKLREKIKAELQAEAVQAVASPAPVVPPTLSTERNVGSRTGPAWSGPTPLADVLNS
jgi:hypothetical protein